MHKNQRQKSIGVVVAVIRVFWSRAQLIPIRFASISELLYTLRTKRPSNFGKPCF